MKLLNPTDDQLDAAFAEKVAGWHRAKNPEDYPWRTKSGQPKNEPNFTSSFDAVLPWLGKCDSWNMEYDQGEIEETIVNVWSPKHGQYKGDGSLPRAIVIALLRSKEVEVEFTQ